MSEMASCWLISQCRGHMIRGIGAERIFSWRGPVGDFPKIFERGTKSGEIWFLPFEIEKTTCFC